MLVVCRPLVGGNAVVGGFVRGNEKYGVEKRRFNNLFFKSTFCRIPLWWRGFRSDNPVFSLSCKQFLCREQTKCEMVILVTPLHVVFCGFCDSCLFYSEQCGIKKPFDTKGYSVLCLIRTIMLTLFAYTQWFQVDRACFDWFWGDYLWVNYFLKQFFLGGKSGPPPLFVIVLCCTGEPWCIL